MLLRYAYMLILGFSENYVCVFIHVLLTCILFMGFSMQITRLNF